jgi:hypothetical protein
MILAGWMERILVGALRAGRWNKVPRVNQHY